MNQNVNSLAKFLTKKSKCNNEYFKYNLYTRNDIRIKISKFGYLEALSLKYFYLVSSSLFKVGHPIFCGNLRF